MSGTKRLTKKHFDGWTLVGPTGDFVLCVGVPLFWDKKEDARGCREGEMQLQRARLILRDKPIRLTKADREE